MAINTRKACDVCSKRSGSRSDLMFVRGGEKYSASVRKTSRRLNVCSKCWNVCSKRWLEMSIHWVVLPNEQASINKKLKGVK